MRIFVTVKAIKGIAKAFGKLESQMLEKQKLAVAESVLLIHSNAIKSIQAVGDGTPEMRYDPKRVVSVSKPGDPPNSDTGRLVQSIKFDFKKDGIVGRIGSNLKYAVWLEFGTEHMAPRSWLAPAVEDASQEVAEIFERAIKNGIKDGT